jgi:DegV family protein with EDD domain
MQLTVENTAVVLDSTADFPEAPKRYPSWRVVPLYVRFGDESYRDYVDIGPAEFYRRLAGAAELPTTSQPTPADFLAAYRELDAYERIYSIHVSAKLSGTFASAGLAAADGPGDRIRLIDSETASAAIALLALAIRRRLERGTTDEEIDALVERFKRDGGLLFTLDTLEYLARGGRIGKAQAMTGQLLQVKPILGLSDGEVVPVKRVRGSRKALEEIAAELRERTAGREGIRVGIGHAEAPERAKELEQLVLDAVPGAGIEIVTTLGAVIGTHAGPGAVGVFWYDEPEPG